MRETMTSSAAPIRLAEELATATRTLERAGVCEARREAMHLWSALADLPSGRVWLERDQPIEADAVTSFRESVRRRARGMPFAYATGRVAFRTLTLAVDPRALIPRPETEGLVELVLRRMGPELGGIAADIGTGSGCIALSLAIEGRFERVVATERSEPAAALARENVARVRPVTPVDVRVGDLLQPLAGERCRVIAANPPYLTNAEWAVLDPAVREFEPLPALVSGVDGLAATRRLLHGAQDVLAPGGVLALEVDERRATAVASLARAAGWSGVTMHRDLFGRPRYAVAVAGGNV